MLSQEKIVMNNNVLIFTLRARLALIKNSQVNQGVTFDNAFFFYEHFLLKRVGEVFIFFLIEMKCRTDPFSIKSISSNEMEREMLLEEHFF